LPEREKVERKIFEKEMRNLKIRGRVDLAGNGRKSEIG
jgi:hypothetical protein